MAILIISIISQISDPVVMKTGKSFELLTLICTDCVHVNKNKYDKCLVTDFQNRIKLLIRQSLMFHCK